MGNVKSDCKYNSGGDSLFQSMPISLQLTSIPPLQFPFPTSFYHYLLFLLHLVLLLILTISFYLLLVLLLILTISFYLLLLLLLLLLSFSLSLFVWPLRPFRPILSHAPPSSCLCVSVCVFFLLKSRFHHTLLHLI